jgi:hypothetical protein
MKKITFTIVLLFSIIFGFSQSLVTTNKAWSNLKTDYTGKHSTEKLKFTIDTIITGQIYKKVERSIDNYQQYWSLYGYIREDAEKNVFYKLDAFESEKLIYSFNLQLFDTITAYSLLTVYTNRYMQSQAYRVIAIDSILIGETFRKRINLSVTEDSTNAMEHWIDSTGSSGGLLHNFVSVVGQDSYTLLCFSEDGIVKYQHPYFDSCYVVTSLEDKYNNKLKVHINPNPLAERSVLVVDNSNEANELGINIFDLTGRIVYSKMFFSELELHRSDFSPGLYFYKISDKSGKVLTGKITIL